MTEVSDKSWSLNSGFSLRISAAVLRKSVPFMVYFTGSFRVLDAEFEVTVIDNTT